MQASVSTNRIVTKIEAKHFLAGRENEHRQLRVAAYCRVSTDSDEQLESYRKGEDGRPEIVPEEAEIVRKIFNLYLEGNSLDSIKEYLEANGIKTKKSKTVWSKQIIRDMLCNERFTGDMLLQKTYTENCINKKVKKNRGEMAKYLITNNHPAIISKEIFNQVQEEMARRNSKSKTSDLCITEQGKYSGKFALTEILVCGECGSPYRRKTWISKGEKKRVWRCLNRVEHGTEYCKKSVSLDEEKLHGAILRGLKNAFEYCEEVSALILSGLSYAATGDDNILDDYVIEQKIRELKRDMEDMVMLSMRTEGDTERFEIEIQKLSEQLRAIREQLDLAKKQAASNQNVNVEVKKIKAFLAESEMNFSEYSEIAVRRLIECIRVMPDKKILIVLKGGATIEEQVE